jgi:glutathione S-transferase
MAINLYLAKKHGSCLYPSDPHYEALALQWSFWETDRLDRQLTTYANHTTVLPSADRNPAAAEAAWNDIAPSFGVLETTLDRRPWLAGPDFTVADLNVASALYRALSMDLRAWPKLQDWLHRCWDRPAGKHARAMRE